MFGFRSRTALAVALAASTISAAPVTSVSSVASDICDTDGLPPEDGHQVPWASCSDTEWGDVPDVDHMVSTVIVSPNGKHLALPFLPFMVTVRVAHLSTGLTDDPNNGYEPEELDASGQIEGHVSQSIQRVQGSGNEPPDARQVAGGGVAVASGPLASRIRTANA